MAAGAGATPDIIYGRGVARLHPHRPRRTVIATVLAKVLVRPSIAAQRKLKGHKTHETSMTALIHDKGIAKTLLDKLCSLAHTRLLGLIP